MLVVVTVLIAFAWSAPNVVWYAVLTIGVGSAFVAAYWEVWRMIMDSPLPPDLCKRCRRGLITRAAATRHGDRFYRCASCGARYRRLSRNGPWLDASGQVYDVMYSHLEQDGLDERAPCPIDESRYWTETVSALLRNKRIRQITRSGGRGACFDKEGGHQ